MFSRYARHAEKSHFVTGSYVIQGSVGRSRPFFQAGAGIVHSSYRGYIQGSLNEKTPFEERETGIVVLFGAGATIDLGRSLFIRPQVRLYGHVGPTLTVLPGVAFGWRF